MKAVKYTKYGSADVLQLKEVEKPVPKENEILIKVHAATVTATDCIFRNGKTFMSRLYTGLTKPKYSTPGDEFSGEIEEVGQNVTMFRKGDQVFGTTSNGFGANTEYICLPEDGAMAIKPENITFEEAAASVDGTLTALPFLRDKAKIQSGQKVLINGASGSVGSSAVQLASYLGAEVTGVCSTENIQLVKSLGAKYVINYTKEDFAQSGKTYDIIFDTVGKISFSRCKISLNQNGVFLEAGIGMAILPQVLWTSLIGSKKVLIAATGLRPAGDKAKDLYFLKELIETGKIKPVLDRCYPLEQIVEAHVYVEKGHKKGNVAISVA
jgi:NADPH:quinone reductase-like Zn-dependent oxidoreductase